MEGIEGAKPTVLFLTGFLFKASIWFPIKGFLEEDIEAIFWDISQMNTNRLDKLVENILSKMPKKFYVCGWSLGGKLALLLAEKAPERILGLVLIATNPIFLETSLWPGIKQQAFTTLYREFLSSFKSALKTFLSLQIIGSRQSTALKKSLSPFLLLDVSREQVSLSFEILAIDQLSIMKKIRVPTRFFLFKQDKLVPFAVAKNIAAVNNRFVQAEVIDNSAHGSIVLMLGPISDVLRSLL